MAANLGGKEWTHDDIGALRRMAREGASQADVAEHLERSKYSIRSKASELHIRFNRNDPDRRFCKRGHEQVGDNVTVLASGYTRCRLCHIAKAREYYLKSKPDYQRHHSFLRVEKPIPDEDLPPRIADRTPCPRCGVRADIGCSHNTYGALSVVEFAA